MENENALFIIPIVVGPIFFAAGLILFVFPPKKINSLYGYRTRSSMSSQERWDYAQRYSSKEMMKWGAVFTFFCLIGLAINPGETIGTIVALAFMIVIIAVIIYRVEKAIRRKFDPTIN